MDYTAIDHNNRFVVFWFKGKHSGLTTTKSAEDAEDVLFSSDWTVDGELIYDTYKDEFFLCGWKAGNTDRLAEMAKTIRNVYRNTT